MSDLEKLEALFAFDSGSGVGINDDVFRAKMKDMRDSSPKEFLEIFTELARLYLNSPHGYGIEDIASLVSWIELEFNWDF